MISIKDFTKKYGESIILESVDIELPHFGCVAILGDSGSGKSTLLNAIAGIDLDYSGSIKINGTDIKKLSDKELTNFRLKNIGYLFQNFNLFNLENVKNNIAFPLVSASNNSSTIINRRIKDLMSITKVSKHARTNANKLSGGEKQRVAISRALSNTPSIVLCDEPTGALDESNSTQIFNILRQISDKCLVIIATHDKDLAYKFADVIYVIKNRNLDKINSTKTDDGNAIETIISANQKTIKSHVPFFTKITYSLHKIKSKKVRSFLTVTLLSLSLVGIGISLLLNQSISSSIQTAFSSLFNGNQVIMSLKNEQASTVNAIYSSPYSKNLDVQNKYSTFIDGMGCNYLVNFEEFFKTRNTFYVTSTFYRYDISTLSARSINEFIWLNDTSDFIAYPYSYDSLSNDEIILGLSYVDMVNLCFHLQIQRSYVSLGNYIKENKLSLALEVENVDWQYSDEQLFEVVAVAETNYSTIYHTNLLFNQVIFEDQMRFPITDDEETYFPWEMYKIYYFKTKEKSDVFLDASLKDEELYNFVFEKPNETYNPLLYKDPKNVEKIVYIYYVDKNGINTGVVNNLKPSFPSLEHYYFVSDYGYSSYASGMVSGFSNNLYASTDEKLVDYAIDAETSLSSKEKLALPEGIVQGNYINSMNGGIRFSCRKGNLLSGRYAKNINEISISKGLAKSLNCMDGCYLYIGALKNQIYYSDKNIEKDYGKAKLVITGIIDDETNTIYHEGNWTINFFRDLIGVSSFNLIPSKVVFEVDEYIDVIPIIETLNKTFSEYKFESPTKEIGDSTNETLNYAKIVTLCFSVMSLIISILLLSTTIFLQMIENKKDIKIFNYLGISNSDVRSIFLTETFLQSFASSILALFELIFISFIFNKTLGDYMGVTIPISNSYGQLLLIFLIGVFVPACISFFLLKIFFKKKIISD